MFLQKINETSVLQLLGKSQTPFHMCIFSLGYNNTYRIFLVQIIKKLRYFPLLVFPVHNLWLFSMIASTIIAIEVNNFFTFSPRPHIIVSYKNQYITNIPSSFYDTAPFSCSAASLSSGSLSPTKFWFLIKICSCEEKKQYFKVTELQLSF